MLIDDATGAVIDDWPEFSKEVAHRVKVAQERIEKTFTTGKEWEEACKREAARVASWQRTSDDDRRGEAEIDDEIIEVELEGAEVQTKEQVEAAKEGVAAFPFTSSDLIGFVVKRKDGTMFRYHFKRDGEPDAKRTTTYTAPPSAKVHMSDWCHHDPTFLPTFECGGVRLFIADMVGVKNHCDEFDLVIDCGQVIPLDHSYDSTDYLAGDQGLVDALEGYVTAPYQIGPDLLKIDWLDRHAPPLLPEFWVKLAEELGKRAKEHEGGKYDVIINCQGGHGRSGTAMVCLMMVMNPEYDAKTAITHLRAIHCSRAIESKDQHNYINSVAGYLGTKANAEEGIAILDYRKAFKALDLPSVKSYQERLK